MNLISAIGVVLSLLPVPAIDKNEDNRAQRLESISIAIGRASERATCTGEASSDTCKPIAADASQVAAELIVIANEETHLMRHVQLDECRAFECDPKKRRVNGVVEIVHQARSLWQLHRAPSWPEYKWQSFIGTSQEATDAAAWQAAKFLAGYRWKCGSTEGAIAGFATGGLCQHKSANYRAGLVAAMRGRIQRLMSQQPKQGGEVAGR